MEFGLCPIGSDNCTVGRSLSQTIGGQLDRGQLASPSWMGKEGPGRTGQTQMEWGQGPGAKHPLGTVQLAQVGDANHLGS